VSRFEIKEFTTLVVEAGSEAGFNLSSLKPFSDRQIYCVADSQYSDNFGHFFWEAMIFLTVFKRLKKYFPSIKFLLGAKRKYKTKIMSYYGLDFEFCDITEQGVRIIKQPRNMVAFMPPISSLITNRYSTYYSELLSLFHHEIQIDSIDYSLKDIEISYFPRHLRVDNTPYPNQDRSFDTSELVSYLTGRDNCLVFDTESSDNWASEIEAVRRSKVIICHDGSSAAVLGFHAQNSTLIVLSNNVTIPSLLRFEKVKLIEEKIREQNKRFFVRAPGNKFTLNLLMPLINGQVQAY